MKSEKQKIAEEKILQLILKTARSSFKKVNLDCKELERIIENKVQFVEEIKCTIKKSLRHLSTPNEYKNEQATPRDYYPFKLRVKSVSEQSRILRKYFPTISSFDSRLTRRKSKTNATGRYAIPTWDKIAGSYNEAFNVVLELLSQLHGVVFIDERRIKVSSKDNQYCSTRSEEALKKIRVDQNNSDILIIHAQAGSRHVGRSSRRAVVNFRENEYPLGPYEIAIILLTHFEYIHHEDNFTIGCTELGLADSDMYTEMSYSIGAGQLLLKNYGPGYRSGEYGVATFFV